MLPFRHTAQLLHCHNHNLFPAVGLLGTCILQAGGAGPWLAAQAFEEPFFAGSCRCLTVAPCLWIFSTGILCIDFCCRAKKDFMLKYPQGMATLSHELFLSRCVIMVFLFGSVNSQEFHWTLQDGHEGVTALESNVVLICYHFITGCLAYRFINPPENLISFFKKKYTWRLHQGWHINTETDHVKSYGKSLKRLIAWPALIALADWLEYPHFDIKQEHQMMQVIF